MKVKDQFSEHRYSISASEHVMKFTLSKHILLASTNRIFVHQFYECGHNFATCQRNHVFVLQKLVLVVIEFISNMAGLFLNNFIRAGRVYPYNKENT